MVLGAWFLSMAFVSAILLGRHVAPLPRPARDDVALGKALEELHRPTDGRRWQAVHVLYAECRCSQRLADHLLTTVRPSDVDETVLLVGQDVGLEGRLRARRFHVVRTSPVELATRWHVQAVPLFVVTDPDHVVRYVGGYTARKDGPAPQDLLILARSRTEGTIDVLPVYGCAVAADLREKLDPTGVF